MDKLLAGLDAAVEARRDDLVGLVQGLVRFDTTVSRSLARVNPYRKQERELQALVAARLASMGAEVDQWEPDPSEFAGHPMMPPWHHSGAARSP